MKIIVATKNAGKLREFKAILPEYEILSMEDIGIDVDVDEDADTFEGNAMKKATEIMKVCGEITIADDSGLVVDALNGEPGVYSARYSGEHGNDTENNLLVLKKMENETNRKAKFVSAVAAAFPDGSHFCVTGEFHGEIDYEMKGTGGFGYDCIFYLPEYGQTSAEISAEKKNRISHRAKALQKLKIKLEEILKD